MEQTELKENEYYGLFNKLGMLRSPMLHKSKKQIRRVWALLPDAAYIRCRKVTIKIGEEIELNAGYN